MKTIQLNNLILKMQLARLKAKFYTDHLQIYIKINHSKYIVDDNKLALTVKQLKDNGFEKLADKYQKIAETGLKTVDGNKIIDLGEKIERLK